MNELLFPQLILAISMFCSNITGEQRKLVCFQKLWSCSNTVSNVKVVGTMSGVCVTKYLKSEL